MSAPPTRTLAGVTVPDTPLITKALAYAKFHINEMGYNHVVRSWLFGTYIADHIPDLQSRDTEVHAIAAILHDLGWATSPALISKDKRFEIDGANAARDFLRTEALESGWDKHRIQLVWDAIALHTTFSIAIEKEVEVKSCAIGILTDFTGPETSIGGVLTRDVWNGILKEFPRDGFKDGVRETLCHICRTKPSTTYDNWVSEFGIKYVDGYVRGPQAIDLLEGGEP